VSDWKIENGRFSLQATVPANTTATVCIPTANVNSVLESGQPAGRARKVSFIHMENGIAVFAVASGNYAFTAEASVQK
jgi:alpha-L-rhamnosidase